MRFPLKRFLSYYRPYRGRYLAVLATAVVGSTLALAFPLLVRYITNDILTGSLSTALPQVYRIGGLMVLLVAVQNVANYVVDYKGHEIGARMESDLRAELFAHMQKLPFAFYDRVRTGELMSRITNDLLLLSELYHHGPEDYVNYFVRFVGSLVILSFVNTPLAIAVFCFMPVLTVFVVYFNRVLSEAMRRNKERIADVNAQAEDTLSGVRVVQSFANEDLEIAKFRTQNDRFLESRRGTYRAEAYFFNGIQTLVQLITITVVVMGSAAIAHASFNLADLITFLLYIGYMTEPILQLEHMTAQFQEGITGFQRFLETMEIETGDPKRPLREDAEGRTRGHRVSRRVLRLPGPGTCAA